MCPTAPPAIGRRRVPKALIVGVNAAERQHDVRRAQGQPWRRWYKTARWARLRQQVLLDEPLCTCDQCQAGKLRAIPSGVVHHQRAHRGDPILFWDRDNLTALSKPCHDRITRAETMGHRADKNRATWAGGIGKSRPLEARTVSGGREGMKAKSKDRR